MLAPRFLRPSSLRSFSSAAALQRTPSIRDITPDNAEEFNTRQREFRKGLEEARKKREEQASQFVTSSFSSSTSPVRDRVPDFAASTPTASSGSSAGRASSTPFGSDVVSGEKQSLGSLSTARGLGNQQEAEVASQSHHKRGPLSSLIYGTKEGQHFDKDIERSFSQVLARGKYVHSIVFHEVKPDKVDEYVQLVGEWYPKMAALPENKVNLVGSWRTQVGDIDTFGQFNLLTSCAELSLIMM